MVDVDGLGAEIETRAVAGTDGYRYLVSFYQDSEGMVRFVDIERLRFTNPDGEESDVEAA